MIFGALTSWLLMIVGVIGFFSMFVLIFVVPFTIRCPNCGGNLSFAVEWPATWNYSVSDKIRFCQFCGVDLDKDMKEISSNQASDATSEPAPGADSSAHQGRR